MFIGFALPCWTNLARVVNSSLNVVVYVILVVIGMELGHVPDLSTQIGNIINYLSALMLFTLVCGVAALFFYDKYYHRQVYALLCAPPSQLVDTPKPKHIQNSLTQLACLTIGFIIAKYTPLTLPAHSITVLLMLLLLLVGISLKSANISLRQILLNKQGLYLTVIFIVATLLGGVAFAILFDLPLTQGLALSSGFGWYSLSGTLMTDAYGAVWGSIALMNDLGREILALIFIPYIMRHSPSSAIGLSGVTSLDFALPTLAQAGGIKIIPLVISFGFLTNVISPILMVFFASL